MNDSETARRLQPSWRHALTSLPTQVAETTRTARSANVRAGPAGNRVNLCRVRRAVHGHGRAATHLALPAPANVRRLARALETAAADARARYLGVARLAVERQDRGRARATERARNRAARARTRSAAPAPSRTCTRSAASAPGRARSAPAAGTRRIRHVDLHAATARRQHAEHEKIPPHGVETSRDASRAQTGAPAAFMIVFVSSPAARRGPPRRCRARFRQSGRLRPGRSASRGGRRK